ncbi:hypothetical protein [Kibdelosporangium aridum]|uniref:hypothetical protein n=1 Tax=Kibdelosporangium aridum TaxID=2030 RepID=UPI00190EA68F
MRDQERVSGCTCRLDADGCRDRWPASVFGVGVWMFAGATTGTEYFAGYVTEKALSVDNLFVFL